jgi:ketosteroid isomerase-like protein
MSEQAVEQIRLMFERFNRAGFEAAASYIAPDTVWHTFPEWPGAEKYEGVDGVRQLTQEWTENFDDYRWEISELIDRGDRVVVLAHHGGESKGAGTPVRQRVAGVFTEFDSEGRASRARFFTSWEQALEVAGASK